MKIKGYETNKYNQNRLKEIEIEYCNNYDGYIKIDSSKLFQTFIGFGGAFTEASGYNLSRVSENVQNEAMNLYFSEEGLNYNLGRISIGGCDFSLGSYVYVKDNDESLESFNISRDEKYIIPMIKKANEIRKEEVKILASPWSPPKWMKDNNLYNYGGKLMDKYYSLYSKYLVKFLSEYQKKGINIKYISLQNEPAATQRWDSCIYSPLEEKKLLETIGPIIEKENKDVKILIWDHNRDILIERVSPIYNSTSSKYAYGTAIHWYDNEPYDNLTIHHNMFPDKHLIHTEGCIEGGTKIASFESGERYGRNIIGNFNNFCEGFIDWNLFLDETGGPNWVNNLCDAPIILHIGPEKIILETSYYFIGHFSKFIKVGAKRVYIENKSKCLVTAFLNPDKSLIVVVQNETEEDHPLKINQKIINFKKRSIVTIIYSEGEINE